MKNQTKEKEAVETYFQLELVKAKLSPTSNPLVFWDKATGEMYYFDEYHETGWMSQSGSTISKIEPRLIKLNDTRA